MSPNGIVSCDSVTDLPPLVERAVDLARQEGFACSCRPEHRRLLFALAAGAEVIGETGTGCGVGLAWLASGARPGTRLVSVELDAERAERAAALFSGCPQVTVLPGDWQEIYPQGPTCCPWTAEPTASPAEGRLTRTSCSGRAALWSSMTSPLPRTGRRVSPARSTRPGCTGSTVPASTRPSYGSRRTWPPS